MGKRNEPADPSTFGETIIQRDIAEIAEENQKICGTNKNVYRYFPRLIDGLKPVEGRFLYSMYRRGNYKGKKTKLSKAGSNTVDFHPHGDSAINDVICALSQPWVNNALMVDIPGNKGDITGEEHGAPRYLDCCISDFGYDCYFSDFENSAVDKKLAYTGEDMEPEYLPAKYPIALINGGFSSIGYGYASNIPQYNFKEMCEATIALIKNPDAKVVIYPDLPSGADIVMTKKEAVSIFETGVGKIKMRAHAEIDYINNVITFTSVPMQVSTKQIMLRLADLMQNGKLPQVKAIEDNTTLKGSAEETRYHGVHIDVILHPDQNPEKVLEILYKSKTMLKKTNPCSVTLVDDYVSSEYSIRSFILHWLDYQRDLVRSTFNNKLIKALEDKHLNDVIQFIYKNKQIPKTFEIADTANETEEYYQKLMKEYNISSLQAKVVGGIKPTDYTKANRDALEAKGEKLEKEIKEITDILRSDDKIDKEIIKSLKEGCEKYAIPRLSRIVTDDTLIVDDDVLIGITEDGYIKKIKFNGSPIGKISKDTSVLGMVFPARETDSITMFDSCGNAYVLPVSYIPLLKEKNTGMKIVKYIDADRSTKIISASVAPKAYLKTDSYEYIMITEKGYGKRVNAFAILEKGSKKSGKPISTITLADDSLAAVICSDAIKRDIIIFTNQGDGMRLPIEEIPLQLPGGKGSRLMTLRPTEKVFGANMMEPIDEFLIYVTSAGKVKRTELQYFPPMKKRDEPIALVNLDSNEYLVSVKSVSDTDRVTFYKKNSPEESYLVKEIPLRTRAAKAEKMIKTPKGDVVVSMVVNR